MYHINSEIKSDQPVDFTVSYQPKSNEPDQKETSNF